MSEKSAFYRLGRMELREEFKKSITLETLLGQGLLLGVLK
jgi:hypothetical protein